MKRRDLLAAFGMGALWLQRGPRGRRQAPPWSFRLDSDLHWSLVARSGLAVIQDAAITVELAGQPATELGDLEGARRLRLGDARGGQTGWHVVGTIAGVELTAQLLDGPPPTITVSARGLADEQRLDRIRFLDADEVTVAGLEPGGEEEDAPVLWINGYQSRDDCSLLELDDAATAVGHWQLAILPRSARSRARRLAGGLALSFGADDAGRGVFSVTGWRIAAASLFEGRGVSVALAPAGASLAVVPGPDAMGALGRLAAMARRASARDVPTGWASRDVMPSGITEADVLQNLEAARARIGSGYLRVIQVWDGYQRAAGDWETNARFPHGHRWLTDRIHDAGYQAGLWLAPFAVSERSGIPVAHPDWLLQTGDGQALVLAEREEWGGKVYGLDAAQPRVQDYLRDLARHATTEWGYDHLTLDLLYFGAAGTRNERGSSPAEAVRAGLGALREGAGRAFVVGSGAPLQPSVGLVDGMRIGPDVEARAGCLLPAAGNVALRSHLHRSAWLNDPDQVIAREPLTPDEVRAWATVAALSGGLAFSGDPLDRMPGAGLEILQRLIPAAPVLLRALGAAAAEPGTPPEWFLAQSREDWWMLGAVNWTDAPRLMSLSLNTEGIRGPLAVYDVWADQRLPDVDGDVTVTVASHGVAALSLRRRRRVPFVVGSTRHLVQGAVDLMDEQWDGRRRVLRARALRLDGRPYSVTVALPPGYRPKSARTDPEGDAAVTQTGQAARLVVAATTPEVEWEIRF